MEFTAKQIAQFVQGHIEGDENAIVNTFAKIEEGKKGAISFLSNPKYTHYVYDTQSSVVLIDESVELEKPVSTTLIRVKNAYECVAKLLQMYESMKPKKTGIDPLAFVSPKAKVAEGVYVGAFAYISDGAEVGEGSQIYPHAYIGEGVKVGKNALIYPNVTVYHGCKLGDNVTLHAGCVIGADGFGFAPGPDGYDKIPQIGIVTIEDDVEIGANTCVDRSTMGSTYIRKGVKLDNLVQIAHNTDIGENTVMSSQVGIAGSTKVGHCRSHHYWRQGVPRCTEWCSWKSEERTAAHRNTSYGAAFILQVTGHLPSPARYVQGTQRPEEAGGRTEKEVIEITRHE